MNWTDRLLLLGLTAVWGLNFSVIKIGLREVPPLLLCGARFALVAFPAVLLLPRPTARLQHVLAYGVLMFTLQFGLLFGGMWLGLTAGLASVALQAQAFFTMAFAALVMGDRPSAPQVCGALIAAVGLLVIAEGSGVDVSLPGLLCVLGAAASWGAANVFSKRKLAGVPPLTLVAWGNLFAVLPVLLASAVIEGVDSWSLAAARLNASTLLALAYIVYPTTLLGFGLWAWQLRRYPAALVAPYTLVVPVFGLAGATLLLGEAIQPWKLLAAALVIGGLVINQFGQALMDRILRLGKV